MKYGQAQKHKYYVLVNDIDFDKAELKELVCVEPIDDSFDDTRSSLARPTTSTGALNSRPRPTKSPRLCL
jgi:hypothetical protein